MGYLEMDLTLSDEAKAMHETIRKFGLEVMRPAGIKLDKMADPEQVIAKGSVLWDVIKTSRELGIHKRGIPKAFGGMLEDMDPKVGPRMAEEMGYADAGLSICLGVSAFPMTFAMMSPEPELQQLVRDYCEDTKGEIIGCWAITEPDHGSDWILGTNPKFTDPKCAPSVRAVLKGDEYIITGQKSAWVSNGTIATHATLHVCLDPSKGMQGGGLAVVPLNLPGITRGKPLDKIGQRALNQGEIFFEEVKLPKKYMVITDGALMSAIAKMILTNANGGMGQAFVGLAQAAYDEALKYAKERVQGGVPIFEHKNIKLQLFNMFIKVEAARAYARRMAAYNHATAPNGSSPHAIAAKVLSTSTAFEVAHEAITIFGGVGLTKEYLIEKLFRDARAAMIEDGENNALSLSGAEDLI
ncbi:MAG: acyl-CoA/acyl-ACP dehydrogenase [Deltaproteobacteria bacterium]|nr:acyl-CoA/acyl-ACP dehydrogenase [Deltaproteobacteria bacterium]